MLARPRQLSLLGRNIPRSARAVEGGASPHAPGSGGGGLLRVGSRLSMTNASFVGSPMVSSRYFTDNA
jgi:hypothetical protein